MALITAVRVSKASRGLHVELRIERVQLQHVVMIRTVRARARAAIHGTGRADLIGAVGQLRPLGHAFGQAGQLAGRFHTTQCA